MRLSGQAVPVGIELVKGAERRRCLHFTAQTGLDLICRIRRERTDCKAEFGNVAIHAHVERIRRESFAREIDRTLGLIKLESPLGVDNVGLMQVDTTTHFRQSKPRCQRQHHVDGDVAGATDRQRQQLVAVTLVQGTRAQEFKQCRSTPVTNTLEQQHRILEARDRTGNFRQSDIDDAGVT